MNKTKNFEAKNEKGKKLQDDKIEKNLRNILIGGTLLTLGSSVIYDRLHYGPIAKDYGNILAMFALKDLLGLEEGDISLPDKSGKGEIFLKNFSSNFEKNPAKNTDNIKIQKFEKLGGKIDIIFSKNKDTYHIKIENNFYQILSQ